MYQKRDIRVFIQYLLDIPLHLIVCILNVWVISCKMYQLTHNIFVQSETCKMCMNFWWDICHHFGDHWASPVWGWVTGIVDSVVDGLGIFLRDFLKFLSDWSALAVFGCDWVCPGLPTLSSLCRRVVSLGISLLLSSSRDLSPTPQPYVPTFPYLSKQGS